MARRGQSFASYSPEIKAEAVRLRIEEKASLREIRLRLNIRSDTQIIGWVKRHESGLSFEDGRGLWRRAEEA
ncbi:IS3 family transposase [Gorillibacterium timonense]|uniref:IS3 family transposase n=1 Tax=Gorillibacterium timonense TaxID=1689269 RepID=UPI00071CFBB7